MALHATALAALLLAAAPPNQSTIPLERFTLDNGLKVVLSEDHSAPVVSTYITYRVGAMHEKKGFTGFAHLFEHMMFNGSANVPEGAYAFYVENTGGFLNGNTEPDRTNYFEVVPSNFLEGMLHLESSRMTSLELTEESLSNEKDVVKEEVRQQQNNQPFVKTILLDWPATAFETWEYSHSIYGSMEDLSNAPVQAFKDFFAQYYVPNNATLVIVGDFDATATKKMVEKYFGPIPKGPENKTAFPEEPEQTEAVYKEVTDPLAPLGMSIVSFDIPAPRTKDRDALDLLAAIMTDGPSARLNRALVDEQKVALQVQMQSGFPIPTYGPGQLATILIPADGKTHEDIRAAFWAEIEKVAEDGVSKRELNRARAKAEVANTQGLDEVLYKSMMLATYETFYGGADKFPGDLERLEKITTKDIKRVAKRYLSQKRSVTIDIKPGAGGMGGLGVGG